MGMYQSNLGHYRLRLEVPRIRGRVGVSSFIVGCLGNGNLVPGGPAVAVVVGSNELPLGCRADSVGTDGVMVVELVVAWGGHREASVPSDHSLVKVPASPTSCSLAATFNPSTPSVSSLLVKSSCPSVSISISESYGTESS